jgi:hypothetical protein
MDYNEFDILEQLIDNIPNIIRDNIEFKVRFGYGTHSDLLKYLKGVAKKKDYPKYPLIWVETPLELDDYHRQNVAEGEINFIIATLSNNELSNKDRNKTTVKILQEVYEYLYDSLSKSRATKIISEKSGRRIIFNYETDTEKGASDIWDVIQFRPEVKFKFNCEVKNIFNVK